MSDENKPDEFPKQSQDLPGQQNKMNPKPLTIRENYCGSEKLAGRKALITGADSGIGRAIAVHFAAEGCDVFFGYLSEKSDADRTVELVEERGRKCGCLSGDVGDLNHAGKLVENAESFLGGLDLLVLNAAEQHPEENLEDIDPENFEKTLRTNVTGYYNVLKHAVPLLPAGSSIILTTSVTAFRGSSHLIDYASTKGAILAMSRSLAGNLAERSIRVNAVAPGPIWTPLIPATFGEEKVSEFGSDTPLGRAGQPSEVAPAYVFLAGEDASYITGHTLHVNGGDYVD